MPPDMAHLSTLTDSNYPILEPIFIVPKVFEPLKFGCSIYYAVYCSYRNSYHNYFTTVIKIMTTKLVVVVVVVVVI